MNEKINKAKYLSGWAILSSTVTGLSLLVLAREAIVNLDFSGLLEAFIAEYDRWSSILVFPIEWAYQAIGFDADLPTSWRHYFIISFIWSSALARLSAKYENSPFIFGIVKAFILSLIIGIGAGYIDKNTEYEVLFYFAGIFALAALVAREEGLNLLGQNVPRLELYWAFFGGYVMAAILFLSNIGATMASG